MAGKLHRLLDAIDPSRTLDDAAARVNEACNSFEHPGAVLKDWQSYKDCVARFHRHVETVVLCRGTPIDLDLEFYWGRCVGLLKHEYGPSGPKAAFELVRNGVEGGLPRVLRDIGRRLAEFYAENEIRARVADLLNGLTPDEWIAATDEYLARYRDLLPRDLTEGSALRIRADFRKVLEQHPRMIQRLSRVFER
ncbi:MAG: hypothetical protein PVI86_17795 [Phycisphaerae bacterium]